MNYTDVFYILNDYLNPSECYFIANNKKNFIKNVEKYKTVIIN
jgi:hypothetical protein